MTTYTKSTNFAAKDSLAHGNPAKIVKGTEIDNEFNAIAGAIAGKVEASDITAALAALTGIVKQVVTSTVTTSFSTSSTAFVATGHSATITPTSASSKILVLLSSQLANQSTNCNSILTIYRGTTNLAGTGMYAFCDALSSAGNTYSSVSANYLDSPASVAALTYQSYIAAQSGSVAVYNAGGSIATGMAVLILLEIA